MDHIQAQRMSCEEIAAEMHDGYTTEQLAKEEPGPIWKLRHDPAWREAFTEAVQVGGRALDVARRLGMFP